MAEGIFMVIMVSLVKDVIAEKEGFIVGGERAVITDYAHSAFLGIECITHNGRHTYSCGSSIVNQAILLTAAHCLEDCRRFTRITVNAGHAHNKKGLKRMGKSFLIHEKYDIRDLCNDLALISLKTTLKLGSTVRRVVLMKKPPYHEKAALAGWGMTDERKHKSTFYLKHISNLDVWSRASCIQAVKRIPVGTFCAGVRKGKDYAAVGDSGSALIVRNFIQIGLVSFKFPRMSRSLVVYTDIGYYYDWIVSNAKILYCRIK